MASPVLGEQEKVPTSLRAIHDASYLTITEVADTLSLPQPTVSRWINRRRKAPADMTGPLARAYGVDVAVMAMALEMDGKRIVAEAEAAGTPRQRGRRKPATKAAAS